MWAALAAVTSGACRREHDGARVLAADIAIEAVLVGPAVQRFAVVMAAGDYVELELAQYGIDAGFDVRGPDSTVVSELDITGGTLGSERYAWVAEAAGQYVIEVRASYPMLAPGRFRIAVSGPRAATSDDRRRAAAFATGDVLAGIVGWKPARGDATGDGLGSVRTRCEALRGEWVALGDRRGEAEALQLCATAARQLSANAEAEALCDRASAIHRTLGQPVAEAECWLERGSSRHQRGDIAEARRSWGTALELARAAGDLGTAATALAGLGISSLARDDFRKARDELTAARANAVAIGRNDTVALADDNLGRAYARLGDAELAIEHYQRALAVTEPAGMLREAGRTHHALALVYRDQRSDDAAARRELDHALGRLQRAGSRDGESLLRVDLARAARDAGDLAGAARELDAAVALAREINARVPLARARAEQGALALERGAIADALAAYAEARAGYAEVGARAAEAVVLAGHARALALAGELEAARGEVAQALVLLDGVRARAPSAELRATYFARVRGVYDLDIDLHMQLDRGKSGPHAVAAFEASERARARTLLEVLKAGGGTAAIGAADQRAAFDRAAGEVARRTADHAALTAGAATAAQIRASETEIAAALDGQRAALDALRVASPRAAELIAPPAMTLARAQALLGDDDVLLEYVVAEPRSYVFAVEPRRLTVRALPGRSELERRARALYDALTARNATVDSEAPTARAARVARADASVAVLAAELAKLIIDPVAAPVAAARRVLVAPDGALAYVPFAVLPSPRAASADGAWMIDNHEIVVLPSASVLAALRDRRATRAASRGAPRLAVIADPVYGAGDPRVAAERSAPSGKPLQRGLPGLHELPRLPFAADEGAVIAGLVPADRVRLATGLDARRELITGGGLAGYDIVHIAAHGLINARNPDLSGVVLSMVDARGATADGFLRLHELYQLELHAELVTLSGCETALGREIRGEGMIGLARGFLHAGAHRVVASLWQVHDRATAELMRRFYTAMLERGLAPPAALRAAARELRDHTPYAAPYFWAAFVLQGDDR